MWRPGPLQVVVDQGAASSAEQFTAVLRDAGAAVVIGVQARRRGVSTISATVPAPSSGRYSRMSPGAQSR
ncbi:MAG: hypothetical protein EON96_16050 [Caulobacteraceae bacterium]|nr:MAG: hypothetical protein EON96_16050 [Caulobacteraceae bacterium]